MKTWYSSVNYGLENIISTIFLNNGANIVKVLDSAIIYEAENEIKLNCINNQFIIISSFISKDLEQSIKNLSKKAHNWPMLKGKTFRIIIMDCGKLVSIPQPVMLALEKSVSTQTKLISNRANPDIEIWVNRRNNNLTFLMVRTKKHASFEKILQKGELKPDIVDVMLRLSKTGGVLVDPFGGSGAIAFAAASMPYFKEIYTGDINEQCVNFQLERLHKYRHCHIQKWDAFDLPFDDHSVDSVITDPPWGEFQTINKAEFYKKFIDEIRRILKAKGSFIFLTSSIDEAVKALNIYTMTYEYFEIKISGKNVGLFIANPTK